MKVFRVLKNSKNWSSSLSKKTDNVYLCIIKVLKSTIDLHDVETITIEESN